MQQKKILVYKLRMIFVNHDPSKTDRDIFSIFFCMKSEKWIQKRQPSAHKDNRTRNLNHNAR